MTISSVAAAEILLCTAAYTVLVVFDLIVVLATAPSIVMCGESPWL